MNTEKMLIGMLGMAWLVGIGEAVFEGIQIALDYLSEHWQILASVSAVLSIIGSIYGIWRHKAEKKKEKEKKATQKEQLKNELPKEDPRENNPKDNYTIALVGDMNVGKTLLARALVRYLTREKEMEDITNEFLHNHTDQDQKTTGVNFSVLKIPENSRLRKATKKKKLILADGKGEYYDPHKITIDSGISLGCQYIAEGTNLMICVVKLADSQKYVEVQLTGISRITQQYPELPCLFVITHVDCAYHPRLRNNPEAAIDYVKRQVTSILSRNEWDVPFFVTNPGYLDQMYKNPDTTTDEYREMEKKHNIPQIWNAIVDLIEKSSINNGRSSK